MQGLNYRTVAIKKPYTYSCISQCSQCQWTTCFTENSSSNEELRILSTQMKCESIAQLVAHLQGSQSTVKSTESFMNENLLVNRV